jgi:hypothetical protein
MRLLILGLVSLAAIAVAGCSKSEETSGSNASGDQAALLPHYMIAAGPVTGGRASGINSSFRITQASAPNGGPLSGITSDLLGGACIVFRARDLGYTQMAQKVCTRDDDCATGEANAHYCQANQCWARPNVVGKDPLCNRSIDYSPPKPWPVGTDVNISPNPIPLPAELQPNAQARAIALLRGKGGGAPHNMVRAGQPTPIP